METLKSTYQPTLVELALWVIPKGYPNYLVSPTGIIYSSKKHKILVEDKYGYLTLSCTGKSKKFLPETLIALAYPLPIPESLFLLTKKKRK